MKVKISYTVDIQDIPEELKKMMKKAKDVSQAVAFSIRDIDFSLDHLNHKKDRSYLNLIKRIEECREELMNIDIKLSDCAAIMTGYNQTLLEKYEEKRDENKIDGKMEAGGFSENSTGNMDI